MHHIEQHLPGNLKASALCMHVQAVAETMMARDGKSPQLRLLVPTPLCGSIIGKGGATIRSFAEDSQAAITVSPQACTVSSLSHDKLPRMTSCGLLDFVCKQHIYAAMCDP